MSVELYLIPITHLSLGGGGSYNVPKYLPHRFNPAEPGLEGVRWAWVTYLLEDIGFIIADVTTAQDSQLSGYSDVLVIPPLDNQITKVPQRKRVRAALEDVMIPGLWIDVGMTYREIVRTVLNLFSFHGRFVALIQGRVFDGSLDLDMTVGDIPQAKRDKLQEAADGFGLDYSGVTGATTIRQLLKGMADQFADEPYRIAGAGLEMIV